MPPIWEIPAPEGSLLALTKHFQTNQHWSFSSWLHNTEQEENMTTIVLLAQPDENTAEENRPTSSMNTDTKHHQTGWREQPAAQEDVWADSTSDQRYVVMVSVNRQHPRIRKHPVDGILGVSMGHYLDLREELPTVGGTMPMLGFWAVQVEERHTQQQPLVAFSSDMT